MRAFTCPDCGQLVVFESLGACTRDAARLRLGRPRHAALSDGAPCANRELIACNGLAAAPGELCFSCALTRTRPATATPRAWRFAKAEAAKRRLLFELLELGLPVPGARERDGGLAFDLLVSEHEAVTTGHADGLITLDLAEADDAYRERHARAAGEPYRTCWATSATRSATTTSRSSSPTAAAARALPRAVRRRARATTRRDRAPLRAGPAGRLGRALRQRLRDDAPVGGLGRDVRPLPAHPRHAADRGGLRGDASPARRGSPTDDAPLTRSRRRASDDFARPARRAGCR